MGETNQELQPAENINIPIEWTIPEDIQSRYVTNALVQVGPNEIYVSLFEIQLPLLFGTPEESKAQLQQTKSVQAKCVGRFVVAPDIMPDVIKSLQAGLDAYTLAKEAQRKG